MLGFLTGCGPRDLIKDVSVRPEIISPNADGTDDITEIEYTLTRQSMVSIYFVDDAGVQHYLRKDQDRSKGPRTAYFSGVIDNHLLPDGTYTMHIEATDTDGRTETATREVVIQDGDPVPLLIENLSIYPAEFTPNRDGISDRVTIGYYLNKEVTRVTVYLLGDDGTKYPVVEDQIREMGAAGSHEHDYDAGIDLGATPPADGTYTVVVEAEDAVGNLTTAEGKLTITGGGVPRVEIVNRNAEWSSTVVPLGGTLTFTCTVRNIGLVPIRTKGPEPGTTYSSLSNYNTLKEYEEPGIFRIGLDYESNSYGRTYPYRWQLGSDDELTIIETEIGPEKYLMPGQTVQVVGHLRIDEELSMAEPYFWIGLIQEQVQIVQDQVEATPISVGY